MAMMEMMQVRLKMMVVVTDEKREKAKAYSEDPRAILRDQIFHFLFILCCHFNSAVLKQAGTAF
jgi:hypothetical protein